MKEKQDISKFIRRNILQSFIFSLIIVFCIYFLTLIPAFSGLIDRVDSTFYDLRFVNRTNNFDNQVAVVALIDEDLEELGSYPVKRSVYAKLIKKLNEYGVETIVFDIHFPNRSSEEEDQALVDAVKNSGNVYLSTFSPEVNDISQINLKKLLAVKMRGNFKELEEVAAGVGHINVFIDRDGVVRRFPVEIYDNERREKIPALGILVSQKYLSFASGLSGDGKILSLGDLTIPLDKQGCIPINYINFSQELGLYTPEMPEWLKQINSKKAIMVYSFRDILDPANEEDLKQLLLNKIVFVGVTIQGIETDIHNTPFSRKYGIFILASFVANFIEGNFINNLSQINLLVLLFGFSFPLTCVLRSIKINKNYIYIWGGSFLIFSSISSAIVFLSIYIFNTYTVMFPIVPFFLIIAGNIFYWIVINFYRKHEETEQVKIEKQEALLSIENYYKTILNSTESGLIITDSKGIILDVNSYICRMTKNSKEDLTESPITETLKFMKSSEDRNESTESKIHDHILIADKKEIPVLVSMTTLQHDDENFHMYSLIDFTTQKETQTSLDKANKELEKAMKSLQDSQEQLVKNERLTAIGQMAAGVAHDFNNLITPILGFSELIMLQNDGKENKELKFNCQNITQAAKEAQGIIQRLNTFANPTKKIEMKKVDLSAIVESIINLSHHKREKKKIEIEYKGNNRGFYIDGNEAGLKECFLNLIYNSTDAMEEKGLITLDLFKENQIIVCKIADNGKGMTKETINKCFDPFYSTKGVNGTGLGLAMVNDIVLRHNGRIEIDSEIDKGTTFKISFAELKE